MTFRPAQFPNNPSSRIQRDERGRWVLPPPAQVGRPASPQRAQVDGVTETIYLVSAFVAADQRLPIIELLTESERLSPVVLLRLAALFHPDAARRERFEQMADHRSDRCPSWVEHFGEAAVTEVTEMPSTEHRHLAIGLTGQGGLHLTVVTVIDPDGRALLEADVCAGDPLVALERRTCAEHGETLRSLPLNTAARLLERSITSPSVPEGEHPFVQPESLRPLLWFVMRRLLAHT